MKLAIYGLVAEATEADIKNLVSADGRTVQSAGRTQYKKIPVVETDLENAKEIISVLNGLEICGQPITVSKLQNKKKPWSRRRKRAHADSASDEKKRRKLQDGTYPEAFVSHVENGVGQVNTSSQFHDPRRKVASVIRDSLNPDLAPKTTKVWIAEDPLANLPTKEPGPETRALIESLNKRYKIRAMLRKKLRQKNQKASSKAPEHHGITSGFESDKKKRPSAEESLERAKEFLKQWLSDGARPRADIMQDARREEIPKTAIQKAYREMRCCTLKQKYWLWPSPNVMTQLEKPLDDFRFSLRTSRALLDADMSRVIDLARQTKTSLDKDFGFGLAEVKEIETFLYANGLRLGVKLPKEKENEC